MYGDIIARVEGTLKTLGIEASEAKTGEGQYNISKDKAVEVMIDVWEENDLVFFQAMSPVSSNNSIQPSELHKVLLEENHGLVEAAFTLINNEVYIKETIECSVFFSQERVLSAITRIAYYSGIYNSRWAETEKQ